MNFFVSIENYLNYLNYIFDKKVRNYSLFDKFLNPYLNPSLVFTALTATLKYIAMEKDLLAELFGPGHFVGLGLRLRLKSEIRSRSTP
jgi:hypothetical protein